MDSSTYNYNYPFGGAPDICELEHLDPEVLSWSEEEVGNWIVACGYSIYRECFTSNFITGRRLILLEASALPKIGITNFIHILDIVQKIRDLLEIEPTAWDRSIVLPPKEILASYLERKSATGKQADALTYEIWVENWEDLKFQPPLGNLGLLRPAVAVDNETKTSRSSVCNSSAT